MALPPIKTIPNGIVRTCSACATGACSSTLTWANTHLPLSSLSIVPSARSIVTESAERGLQQRITTGFPSDKGRTSVCKFCGVISRPGIGVDVSAGGFPSELKSTACEKFGGSVILMSSLLNHAIFTYIYARIAAIGQYFRNIGFSSKFKAYIMASLLT